MGTVHLILVLSFLSKVISQADDEPSTNNWPLSGLIPALGSSVEWLEGVPTPPERPLPLLKEVTSSPDSLPDQASTESPPLADVSVLPPLIGGPSSPDSLTDQASPLTDLSQADDEPSTKNTPVVQALSGLLPALGSSVEWLPGVPTPPERPSMPELTTLGLPQSTGLPSSPALPSVIGVTSSPASLPDQASPQSTILQADDKTSTKNMPVQQVLPASLSGLESSAEWIPGLPSYTGRPPMTELASLGLPQSTELPSSPDSSEASPESLSSPDMPGTGPPSLPDFSGFPPLTGQPSSPQSPSLPDFSGFPPLTGLPSSPESPSLSDFSGFPPLTGEQPEPSVPDLPALPNFDFSSLFQNLNISQIFSNLDMSKLLPTAPPSLPDSSGVPSGLPIAAYEASPESPSLPDFSGFPPLTGLPSPQMPSLPDFSGFPPLTGQPSAPQTPSLPDFSGFPPLTGLPSSPQMPSLPDFSGFPPLSGLQPLPSMPALPNFDFFSILQNFDFSKLSPLLDMAKPLLDMAKPLFDILNVPITMISRASDFVLAGLVLKAAITCVLPKVIDFILAAAKGFVPTVLQMPLQVAGSMLEYVLGPIIDFIVNFLKPVTILLHIVLTPIFGEFGHTVYYFINPTLTIMGQSVNFLLLPIRYLSELINKYFVDPVFGNSLQMVEGLITPLAKLLAKLLTIADPAIEILDPLLEPLLSVSSSLAPTLHMIPGASLIIKIFTILVGGPKASVPFLTKLLSTFETDKHYL